MYSQRKAETPAAIPIFASGKKCSSTRAAIDFKNSDEHDVGVREMGLSNPGITAFILSTGHENSSDRSFS